MRPQGAQGPLAVNLESFARYQREDAWTWEHMALTRARALTGSEGAIRKVDAILSDVLGAERDAATLKADLLKMRSEMAAHKPAKGPLDVKLLRGGLVDIEFLVHFIQLRDRTGLTPAVDEALGQIPELAQLVPAHVLMTRLLVGTRLLAPDLAIPAEAQQAILARLCEADDFDGLLARLGDQRRAVAQVWHDLFDERLELD